MQPFSPMVTPIHTDQVAKDMLAHILVTHLIHHPQNNISGDVGAGITHWEPTRLAGSDPASIRCSTACRVTPSRSATSVTLSNSGKGWLFILRTHALVVITSIPTGFNGSSKALAVLVA